MIKKEIRDCFGTEHSYSILPRQEIEDIINDYSYPVLMVMAWKASIPGKANGEVHIELTSGELTTHSFSQCSGRIDQAYICLASVSQNFDPMPGDWNGSLLTEEEYQIMTNELPEDEQHEQAMWEYCGGKIGIDMDERLEDYLFWLFENDQSYRFNDWKDSIDSQLSDIYN